MKQKEFLKLNQVDAYTKAKKVINDLYNSDNGKKFIHHLIYSYINGDIRYILFSKSLVFDCITNSQLETVYNKSRKCSNKEISDLLATIKKDMDETEKSEIYGKINKILSDILVSNPIPRVAVRTEKSNKILGIEELQALTDFIQEQVNNHNKLIIGMVKFAKGEESSNKKKSKDKKKSTKINNKNSIGANDELRAILESAIK